MDPPDPVLATRVVPWLCCTDLERSLAFYCDVLGFTVRGVQPEERSAYVEYGGARIMLQERGEASLLPQHPGPPYGSGVHFLIETAAVDALWAAVRRAVPGSVQVEPRNRWYRIGEAMEGHREVILADPDGYLFRFYQRLEGLEEA